MGTRADFYVGRGESAEWLGSIAWDGDPESIDRGVIEAFSEEGFRKAVSNMFARRDDATTPDMGWPWPWTDSQTTDYAYAYDGETRDVFISSFGRPWFVAIGDEPEGYDDMPKTSKFPNMEKIQKVTFGRRSGLLIMG